MEGETEGEMELTAIAAARPQTWGPTKWGDCSPDSLTLDYARC